MHHTHGFVGHRLWGATTRTVVMGSVSVFSLQATHGLPAFDSLAAWIAPKNKMYCATMSLTNRVSLAIGIVSVGLLAYYRRLFSRVGITMSKETLHQRRAF